MNSNNKENKRNKKETGTTTTIIMVIVIRPIWSTYRMYVWNKFVHFDLLLNFIIIQEEVETETKRPVIIQFWTNRYQFRQQQKSISDFAIYWYRYNNNNNNNNNKGPSGSLFCLRERRQAHILSINIMGGIGADYQQQQQQRKQIGTTTTTTTTTMLMVIVIQPIWSTYRMYLRNKSVNFDCNIHFDCDF